MQISYRLASNFHLTTSSNFDSHTVKRLNDSKSHAAFQLCLREMWSTFSNGSYGYFNALFIENTRFFIGFVHVISRRELTQKKIT